MYFFVLYVIHTVIYVEYPPITVDPLFPTSLGTNKICLKQLNNKAVRAVILYYNSVQLRHCV